MKIILIAFAICIVISTSVFVFANNAMATTTHVSGNSKPAVTKDDSHTKTTKPHEGYCKELPTTQCMNYHHPPPPHKPQHPPGGPCEARINCPPSECKKGEFINPITHKCVPKGKCVDICPPKPVHHSKAYNQGYQMGCRDGPDQENFIGTGGLAHHSKSIR
jgi:hypothetical protein